MLQHNLFSYCYNNPIMYCDPNGYNPIAIWIIDLIVSALAKQTLKEGIKVAVTVGMILLIEKGSNKSNELIEKKEESQKSANSGGGNDNNDTATTIVELTQGLNNTTKAKGITTNLTSSGGYKQALSDFNSLKPSNVKNILTKFGPGKQGILNGKSIVVRPSSTSGEGATLEIQFSTKNILKIRYGE